MYTLRVLTSNLVLSSSYMRESSEHMYPDTSIFLFICYAISLLVVEVDLEVYIDRIYVSECVRYS